MTNAVKSSSLPAIILNVRSSFAGVETAAKVFAGPRAPSPGPAFPRVVTAAESEVSRSIFERYSIYLIIWYANTKINISRKKI